MQKLFDLIASHGGVAYTRELSHIPRNVLDVYVMYGRVLRVKKGMWALPDLDPLAIAAIRAGGRLACVSALAYHGVIAREGAGLHICAPAGVANWRPRPGKAPVVRHWSRAPQPGDRLAVTVEAAWAQWELSRRSREKVERDAR